MMRGVPIMAAGFDNASVASRKYLRLPVLWAAPDYRSVRLHKSPTSDAATIQADLQAPNARRVIELRLSPASLEQAWDTMLDVVYDFAPLFLKAWEAIGYGDHIRRQGNWWSCLAPGERAGVRVDSLRGHCDGVYE